ncbi:NAD(P)/FAD-dependent oxidoreductase [Halanaerobium praevalens]|uniref:HI0933 family protein n=1 Tax=Halanaerobium praevalens (strain ATCC 33744 / DSM 2228 / GSL) TaxID=572479 RepID=E3DS10_HALPG|nr:NAD(P)/FAD-dependent oxidoreductase [Halanaerobium praevalens]ADO77134.1 HI0933 family protein [Halanaerobium praevalens DSM 2228]
MAKVIIIGGGPAGMMAALRAAKNQNEVFLIEKNKNLGKKLLITGKGRCNLTNYSDLNNHIKNIVDQPEFMYSSLAEFDAYRLYYFFEGLGLKLKIERGDRVFPKSNRSQSVLRVLQKELYKNEVKIITDQVIEILTEAQTAVGVKLKFGGQLKADKIILAAGGASYPQTGSDGSGFKLAKALGHQITKPEPGLCGLKTKNKLIYEAESLKLKYIELKLLKNEKEIYSVFGDLNIREDYLDGPLVISASMFIDQNPADYQLEIDLKPALDYQSLDQRILRDFEKYANKFFANSLGDLLPQKLIPVIIKSSSIAYNKTVNQITAAEREELLSLLKSFKIEIKAKKGFKRSIVTRGGVNTAEINPKTLASKLIENLYFAGEVIDVAALTGGYNLQIAFATGYKAGSN